MSLVAEDDVSDSSITVTHVMELLPLSLNCQHLCNACVILTTGLHLYAAQSARHAYTVLADSEGPVPVTVAPARPDTAMPPSFRKFKLQHTCHILAHWRFSAAPGHWPGVAKLRNSASQGFSGQLLAHHDIFIQVPDSEVEV